jgi:hypothetical protein
LFNVESSQNVVQNLKKIALEFRKLANTAEHFNVLMIVLLNILIKFLMPNQFSIINVNLLGKMLTFQGKDAVHVRGIQKPNHLQTYFILLSGSCFESKQQHFSMSLMLVLVLRTLLLFHRHSKYNFFSSGPV